MSQREARGKKQTTKSKKPKGKKQLTAQGNFYSRKEPVTV